MKSGVPSDEMGRPVPSVAGSKVVQAAVAPAVVPVPCVAGEGLVAAPGEGRSVGCSSGQAGATLLPTVAGMAANPAASPPTQAVELDTSAVGVAAAAIKGKQKLLSGQQGAVDVLQHSDVEVTRLEPVCPAKGLDTDDVGWTRVGNKRKQKKQSGRLGGAAVHHQPDGEGLQLEPMECVSRSWAEECERSLLPHAGSASVSRGKLKGKALHSSK